MKYKSTFRMLLFALLFVGCAKDVDTTDEQLREEIKFATSIGLSEETQPFTRADIAFDAGTKLNIIVRDNSNSPFDEVTTVAEAKTGLVTDKLECTPILYWDDLGGKVADLKLIGIHPPVEVSDITSDKLSWEVNTDQSGGLAPATYDLMFAGIGSYKYDNRTNPAALNFKHALTKISVTLVGNTDFPVNELDNATVTLKDIPATAKFTITDGSFGEAGAISDLKPFKAEVMDEGPKLIAYAFTVLAIPHSIDADKVIATVVHGGNTYSIKPKTSREFKAGEHTNYTVTITKTAVTASASIVDWTGPTNENLDPTRLPIDIGEFTINNNDDVTITEGSTVDMQLTGSGSDVHDAQFTYKSDNNWEITTPVYWDDITVPVTKIDALLTIKPELDGPTTGEHYFTGSITGDFGMQSVINLNGDSDVPFFSHPLSKIGIEIQTSSGTDKIDIKIITEVKIPDCYGYEVDGASIIKGNTTDLSITGSCNASETVNTCSTAYIYPQTLTTLCKVTVDNNTYDVVLPEDKQTFVAGSHYTFTVTITKTTVGLACSVKDWDLVEGGNIDTGL